jgi:hypothetical protein
MGRLWPRIPEIKVAGRTEKTVVREQNASPQKSGEAVNSLRARAGSGKAMQRSPFAKLSVLGMCVSVLAALFLAAVPDFQPNIVLFPQRVALFALRYTAPICFLQLSVFWILSFIGRR